VENESKISILIIEADENVLTTNKRVLQRAFGGNAGCRGVRSFDEARKVLRDKDSAFDLILFDIMLSDGFGLDHIPVIHAASDAPILIMSTKNTPHDIIEGIERGGDNYITKPYEPEVFTKLVRDMVRRERKREVMRPTVTVIRGKLTLDLIAGRAYIGGLDIGLDKNEFATLSVLVREEGKIIDADNLLKMIRKSEMGNDRVALWEKISSLRSKLESGNSGYTISIHGEGYCFETKT